jgi:hypothetical protein
VGWYAFSHLIFWVSGISLLIFLGINKHWEHLLLVLGIIVVRSILFTIVFRSARKKLEGKVQVFWSAFFDLVYIGYFWVLGAFGYKSRKVKWK